MSACTPGPWSVVRRRDGLAIAPVGLVLFGEHDEQHVADIALAAAAPELLEALLGVLRVADRATDEFDAARAAIEKARGER